MELMFGLGSLAFHMGKRLVEAKKLAKEDSDGWNGEYRDIGSTVDASPMRGFLEAPNEGTLIGSVVMTMANSAARALYKGSVNKRIDFLPDDLLNL